LNNSKLIIIVNIIITAFLSLVNPAQSVRKSLPGRAMKAHAPCLYLPAKRLGAKPHLPAFWSAYRVLPWQGEQPNGQLALPEATPAPAGMGVIRRFTHGSWARAL
jgi:hypothetical protein